MTLHFHVPVAGWRVLRTVYGIRTAGPQYEDAAPLSSAGSPGSACAPTRPFVDSTSRRLLRSTEASGVGCAGTLCALHTIWASFWGSHSAGVLLICTALLLRWIAAACAHGTKRLHAGR